MSPRDAITPQTSPHVASPQASRGKHDVDRLGDMPFVLEGWPNLLN